MLLQKLTTYTPSLEYFVDIRDAARLHAIALVAPDVQNERLFAFAAPYNVNIVLDALRRVFPHKEFPHNISSLGHDISRYPNARAEALLRAYYPGHHGWTTLEQAIRDTGLDGY